MKKIIYSLVIMIAAGSLFTSCIEQVEPLGIQDMRFAKAEYIRALKDLRAADAEYVRAQAAFELARGRYKDAESANLNALTEYQKLLNERQALINEARQDTNEWVRADITAKIDSLEKLMAENELKHQKTMVANQDSLANAQERLRVALRNIALASQSLTAAEKEALENATKAYEIAYKKVAKQTVEVFKAQQDVHAAEIALAKADKEIDEDTYQYVDALEYYKRKLLVAEASALLNGAALLAIGYNFDDPTDVSGIVIPEDLAEWKGQIDALADSLAILDYSKAATITEIANYYVANVHDGYKTFNNKVAEFKNLWWEDKDDPTTEPTAPSKPDAEPKQSDFPASNYLNDSLDFPVLAKKQFSVTEGAIYDKFTFLLRSYKEDSPLSKAETKNKMIYTQNDTVKFGPLGDKTYSGMKEFVLGARGNGEGSQVLKDSKGTVKATANYGLWGAYDILERELVVTPDEAPTAEEIAEALKQMNIADSTWTADRKILIDGITKNAGFKTAYEQYEQAVATEVDYKEQMVQAIADLKAALDPIVGKNSTLTDNTGIDHHDSTAILGALKVFAEKRNQYLEYSFKKGDAHNLKYFRFGVTEDAEHKTQADSVLFTALSFEDLAAKKYDRDPDKDGLVKYEATGAENDKQAGLANIMNQLLGEAFAKAIETNTVASFTYSPMYFFGDLYEYTAPDTFKKKVSGSYTDYTPSGSTTKKGKVLEALNEYIRVFKAFWNVTPTPATITGVGTEAVDVAVADYFSEVEAQGDKIATKRSKVMEEFGKIFMPAAFGGKDYNPECYTLNTFTAPYNVVTFSTAHKIVPTDAISAILNSVDPTVKGKGDNYIAESTETVENETAIFKGGATDFWNYMWRVSEYNRLTGTTVKEGLKTIKTWIEGVAGAYDADVAAAPGKATAAYNTKHAEWQTKKNTYDTEKAEWDEYAAAKAAFVGTYPTPEGETEDWITPAGDTVCFYDFIVLADYDEFSDFFHKDEVSFELAFEDPIYEVYNGKWIKELQGQQLANAEAIFPKLPENMKAWQDELDSINDRKEHVETLQTAYGKAYKSAAKAKYDVEGSDLATVIENVQKQVVDDFAEVIDAYNEAVGTEGVKGDIQFYTEAIRDYDENVHVGKVHPAELALANAKKTLAIETSRLEGYQNVLAYAKANLDKILEYIKSLDVNFVVVTDQDIDNNK